MGIFRRDDRVSHLTFGAGVVVDVDERYLTVAFDASGVRKFIAALVRLERSDLPLPVRTGPSPKRGPGQSTRAVGKRTGQGHA